MPTHQWSCLTRHTIRYSVGDPDTAVAAVYPDGAAREAILDAGRCLRVIVRDRLKPWWHSCAGATSRSPPGVLLLMMASVGALITYTRRAQKLADLQMDFVAGISHELRTPLTVIHTAAYNLRGKLAANPAQVERYGVLIQQESGRLKLLVEQVLRFSGATSGRVIQNPEPLSVAGMLEETLDSVKAVFQEAGCVLETHIDADLPIVLGDSMALKQALQNLLHNAAKYGAGESHWVGVTAAKGGSESKPTVEIRVADRGPGIPADEQGQIFDPFFRGRRALQDQIHGTGLGLNLAKKIIEAHGGSIQVKSAAMKGAEFIVRLPAAPAGEAT